MKKSFLLSTLFTLIYKIPFAQVEQQIEEDEQLIQHIINIIKTKRNMNKTLTKICNGSQGLSDF